MIGQTYTYSLLSQQLCEIRLIHVKPSTFELPTIDCAIETVSLNSSPKYNALSYCWGSSDLTRTVRVQGADLGITESAYQAIKHLRQSDNDITLWIDGICINQRDDQEKSWQVQMMRDIYASAQNVTVWLGPPADDSHLAFEFFQEYGSENGSLVDGLDALKEDRLTDSHGWGDPEQRKHRYRVFAALKALYARAWWERVWVLQEVALARNLFLVCGKDKIDAEIALAAFRDADKFYRAASTMDLDENQKWVHQELREELNNISINSFMRIGRPIVMLESRERLGRICLPLEEILIRTRLDYLTMLRATDPRDVIYGVLGLASDVKELGIVPDYGLSCRNVYTAATQALLFNGHFASLYHAYYDKEIAELPSWVPDWSSLGPGEVSLLEFSARSRNKYQAGGCSPFSPTFLDIDNQKARMVVKGVVLGSVTRLGKASKYADFKGEPGDDMGISIVQKVLAWVLQLSDFINSAPRAEFESTGFYKTEKTSDPAQALDSDTLQSLTMVWRTLNFGQETTAKFGGQGKWQRMTNRGVGGIKRAMKIFGFDDPAGLEEGQQLENDLFTVELINAITSSHNRVPFLTGDKRFGLGPSKMSVGDTVAVFLGVPSPFVIRRVEEGLYSLVGPAYIDGIMFGELIINENEIETLILC